MLPNVLTRILHSPELWYSLSSSFAASSGVLAGCLGQSAAAAASQSRACASATAAPPSESPTMLTRLDSGSAAIHFRASSTTWSTTFSSTRLSVFLPPATKAPRPSACDAAGCRTTRSPPIGASAVRAGSASSPKPVTTIVRMLGVRRSPFSNLAKLTLPHAASFISLSACAWSSGTLGGGPSSSLSLPAPSCSSPPALPPLPLPLPSPRSACAFAAVVTSSLYWNGQASGISCASIATTMPMTPFRKSSLRTLAPGWLSRSSVCFESATLRMRSNTTLAHTPPDESSRLRIAPLGILPIIHWYSPATITLTTTVAAA